MESHSLPKGGIGNAAERFISIGHASLDVAASGQRALGIGLADASRKAKMNDSHIVSTTQAAARNMRVPLACVAHSARSDTTGRERRRLPEQKRSVVCQTICFSILSKKDFEGIWSSF